jgi:uncharacterized protein YegJ (DUF2314 family)
LIWKAFSPKKIAEGEDKPIISLVLLLKEPRYLEARIVAEIVSSAWGGKYSFSDMDEDKANHDEVETRWVVGRSPLFLIQCPEGMFMLNNFSQPYWSNKEEVIEEVRELRLRNAIEEHTAWLSVDLMGEEPDQVNRPAIYAKIAKLISELSGPDCVALLQPEGPRINVWDEALSEKLSGGKNVDELFEINLAPVKIISDDDPRMKAAVAEARSRWPEFVEAFQKKDCENYAVKAPVTGNGNKEFIWIEVKGLEPEYIHGTLGNDPVNLGNLKFGDQVEVPLKDLNDWVFVRDGKPTGMFTLKVLMADGEVEGAG